MSIEAKHAFGSSENLSKALENGSIDKFDILLLDGDTDPKIGWVDKDGEIKIVQNGSQIVRVDELPVSDGDIDVIYVYNNECYIWNGNECVPVSNSTNALEVEKIIEEKLIEATVTSEDIEELFK